MDMKRLGITTIAAVFSIVAFNSAQASTAGEIPPGLQQQLDEFERAMAIAPEDCEVLRES